MKALAKELQLMKSRGWDGPWRSIYLGGGTPSLLSKRELSFLFEQIHKEFEIELGAEVTLEANPEDIFPEQLKLWKALGINRLSIGIQSFDDEDLRWMNRSHSSQKAQSAIEWVRESDFKSYSIDLIYGLPTKSSWLETLEKALAFSPPHLSAYALTVEEKTVLGHRVNKGIQKILQEERVEEHYQLLCKLSKEANLTHYEISNFAKSDQKAQHNSAYWNNEPYLGIGPSAHSFDGKSRWWNISNNHRYKQAILTEESWFEKEDLSDKDRWNERLMTSLRRAEGISLQSMKDQLPTEEVMPEKELQAMLSKAWLEESEGQIRIPEIHWLLADHITSQLML